MSNHSAEKDALLAEIAHWKAHAEEAGQGFAQVCRDYARVSARNVALGEFARDFYAHNADLLSDYWRAEFVRVFPQWVPDMIGDSETETNGGGAS